MIFKLFNLYLKTLFAWRIKRLREAFYGYELQAIGRFEASKLKDT